MCYYINSQLVTKAKRTEGNLMNELLPMIIILAAVGFCSLIYSVNKAGKARLRAALEKENQPKNDREWSQLLLEDLKLLGQVPQGARYQRELVQGMVAFGRGPSWLTDEHSSDIQGLMITLTVELLRTRHTSPSILSN
jgi:hypothetical protein